jgi:hypothetical protein
MAMTIYHILEVKKHVPKTSLNQKRHETNEMLEWLTFQRRYPTALYWLSHYTKIPTRILKNALDGKTRKFRNPKHTQALSSYYQKERNYEEDPGRRWGGGKKKSTTKSI